MSKDPSPLPRPLAKLQPWQFSLRSLFGLTTWIAVGLGLGVGVFDSHNEFRYLGCIIWLIASNFYLIRFLLRLARYITYDATPLWFMITAAPLTFIIPILIFMEVSGGGDRSQTQLAGGVFSKKTSAGVL